MIPIDVPVHSTSNGADVQEYVDLEKCSDDQVIHVDVPDPLNHSTSNGADVQEYVDLEECSDDQVIHIDVPDPSNGADVMLISDISMNEELDEKSCFRIEGNKKVFYFRCTNNELNIAEAFDHLYQLYFDKNPPISVFFNVCGRVVELMAYHYPSFNTDAKSNTKTKCSFISVVQDPILLYRWSERGCLIINHAKKKRLYFSMCQMLHSKTEDDSYICLSIMHIMCVSNKFAFSVYNTKCKGIEYWESNEMSDYICRPDMRIAPNKIVHYQKLLYAHYEQNQWIYKEERLVAIDTHYPGDFSADRQNPNTYHDKAIAWEVRRGLRNAFESDDDRELKKIKGDKRKASHISEDAIVSDLPRAGNAIINDNVHATEMFYAKTSQKNLENVMKKYAVLDKETYAASLKKMESRMDAAFKNIDDKIAGLDVILNEKPQKLSKKRSTDNSYDDMTTVIDKKLESFSKTITSLMSTDRSTSRCIIPAATSSRNVDIIISSDKNSFEELIKNFDKKLEDQLKKIDSKVSWDEELNQSLIRQNRSHEQGQIFQKSLIDLENYKAKTAIDIDLDHRIKKANIDLEIERKKIELELYKKEEIQKMDLTLTSDTRNAAINALDRSNLLHTNDRLLSFKIESQRRIWDADDKEQDMKFESYRVSNRIRESYASTNNKLSNEHRENQNDLNLLRARKAKDGNIMTNGDDED